MPGDCQFADVVEVGCGGQLVQLAATYAHPRPQATGEPLNSPSMAGQEPIHLTDPALHPLTHSHHGLWCQRAG